MKNKIKNNIKLVKKNQYLPTDVRWEGKNHPF